MNPGDIFHWQTTKAKGYNLRPKDHIFICRTDSKNNVFLFISKGERDGDYKITKPPYSFLLSIAARKLYKLLKCCQIYRCGIRDVLPFAGRLPIKGTSSGVIFQDRE
jgi:hypothetical protein